MSEASHCRSNTSRFPKLSNVPVLICRCVCPFLRGPATRNVNRNSSKSRPSKRPPRIPAHCGHYELQRWHSNQRHMRHREHVEADLRRYHHDHKSRYFKGTSRKRRKNKNLVSMLYLQEMRLFCLLCKLIAPSIKGFLLQQGVAMFPSLHQQLAYAMLRASPRLFTQNSPNVSNCPMSSLSFSRLQQNHSGF